MRHARNNIRVNAYHHRRWNCSISLYGRKARIVDRILMHANKIPTDLVGTTPRSMVDSGRTHRKTVFCGAAS